MAPQDGGHDAHHIEDSATHAQKADLQRQAQLQGRLPPLLNDLPFGRREREERLDLEAVSSRGICFKPKNMACHGVIAHSWDGAQ
jgi:hypothetical protein